MGAERPNEPNDPMAELRRATAQQIDALYQEGATSSPEARQIASDQLIESHDFVTALQRADTPELSDAQLRLSYLGLISLLADALHARQAAKDEADEWRRLHTKAHTQFERKAAQARYWKTAYDRALGQSLDDQPLPGPEAE